MSKFLDDKFMLENETAIDLYKKFAKDMPVYDFHCHLDAEEIASDKVYQTLTEVWLKHDHYKWRLMRWYGVEEHYITGEASDWEKFEKWAEVLSYSYGNPVYVWSHMELKNYFNIDTPLNKDNAKSIYDKVNEQLKTLSVREMIKRSNVQVICTTNDPVENLEHHQVIRADERVEVRVAPTFRPDKIINIGDMTLTWINGLSEASNLDISDLDSLKQALKSRVEYFHAHQCRMSDHSLEQPGFVLCNDVQAEEILKKLLNKESLSSEEKIALGSYMQVFLGKLYASKGWTMQLHIGAMRDNNKDGLLMIGKDSGFDALNDYNFIDQLSLYLSALSETKELPKTVLYCLNPKDYTSLSVLSGCYQGQGQKGKVQLGAAWWFNDNKRGIKEQLEILSVTGMLSQSIGMLTDSRSFLSFTRHDYYRRILCSMVGHWIENGEIPEDNNILKEIIEGVSFNNAKQFIGI